MAARSQGRSAADLIADLRGYGLSVAEIAAELGRSPRMVRKVVAGESSGASYVATLAELVDTGQARTRPPRRRDAQGRVVPVRAGQGAAERTRRPEEPAAQTGAGPGGRAGGRRPSTSAGTAGGVPAGGAAGGAPATGGRRGGFSEETTYLPGGVRQHSITAPRSNGRDREAARERLMERLRAAARGQRGGRRNVRFNVTLADGRVVEVGARGGYAVSSVLTRAKGEGNDPLGWLSGEIASRVYLEGVSLDIVRVDVTVF